ncbi:unnamed protein product [Mytilus edulis]|uniref:RNase H type-1 domain-containing protein n=1 Tax=Mytilus edulis TaxID=6550 RepID=A0A8S3VE63_MYTED|nr:unnamed protein product [Mytilus edulis]
MSQLKENLKFGKGEKSRKFISPLGKMYQQTEDMKDTELVDIDKIEPQYEYQGLVSVIRAPDYWRNIGSSKSRTAAQIEEGKQIISEQVQSQTPNTAVAFTDGSYSQTALGILTLNWKSDSYHQTINEIKGKIKNLKRTWIFNKLKLDTGHANIKGNDEADSLAKEAAKEAETLAVDDIVFTKQDVKKATRNSVTKKWQCRWENIVILGVTISDFILK